MFGIAIKDVVLGQVQKPLRVSESNQRSLAGRLFHQETVQSVCVFDERGDVSLYLKKTPEGVYREGV